MYILICLSIAIISYLASSYHDTFCLEILVKLPNRGGLNSISPFLILFLTTAIRASPSPKGPYALPSLVAFKVGLGNPGRQELRYFWGVHEVKIISLIKRFYLLFSFSFFDEYAVEFSRNSVYESIIALTTRDVFIFI